MQAVKQVEYKLFSKRPGSLTFFKQRYFLFASFMVLRKPKMLKRSQEKIGHPSGRQLSLAYKCFVTNSFSSFLVDFSTILSAKGIQPFW